MQNRIYPRTNPIIYHYMYISSSVHPPTHLPTSSSTHFLIHPLSWLLNDNQLIKMNIIISTVINKREKHTKQATCSQWLHKSMPSQSSYLPTHGAWHQNCLPTHECQECPHGQIMYVPWRADVADKRLHLTYESHSKLMRHSCISKLNKEFRSKSVCHPCNSMHFIYAKRQQ